MERESGDRSVMMEHKRASKSVCTAIQEITRQVDRHN